MTVAELSTRLNAENICLPYPEREVVGAYVGDLLSWVMGRAPADCAWVTIMSNLNVVAVASLADVAMAVVCEDSEIGADVIRTALEKNVNLVRSSMPIYEFCVALSKLLK